MRSNFSLKTKRPAMTIETILIAPSKTPWDKERTERKASQTTNSRQKQIMPTHNGNDPSIDFQRAITVVSFWSAVAANLSDMWPTVSSVTLITQMKIAIEDNRFSFGWLREWCRMSESNWRPSHYKCAALPTELIRHLLINCIYNRYYFTNFKGVFFTSCEIFFSLFTISLFLFSFFWCSSSACNSKNIPWPFSREKIPSCDNSCFRYYSIVR